jgi:hypothetical protein
MMKKLLVLALVLSVVGLANAGLSLAWNEADQQVVMLSDEAILGGAGINNGIGVIGAMLGAGSFPVRGELTGIDPTLAQYSGEDAVSFGLPYDGGVAIAAWGKPLVDSPAGDWVYAQLLTQGLIEVEASKAIVQVDLTDGDGVATGTSLFLGTDIPEPMTMLLLGLGGLFLRKKK